MKRVYCAVMALILAGCLLTGCGAKKQARLTAENEIITYTRTDEKKTQLTVSSLGNNADLRSLTAAFEKKNPDVQIICLDLANGTAQHRPVADWVEHGAAPDIMFVNPDTFTDSDWVIKYMEDLSTKPAIERFEAEALNRAAVRGFVYFLPAPSEINCIIYNKALFEQYGWQAPVTFDDFVALCAQIREDTLGAVQPWNPNAKYDNVLTIALEAFVYEELFGGLENRSWYNSFCRGEATFAGHMEPFFDMVQTLIDQGILLEEHFSYSATARGEEFQTGQIAMYNAPISQMKNGDNAFSYMPYPTISGELGYVSDFFSAMLCVPKKAHTDAEKAVIDRFIDFYSSVEGQQALIGGSLMVSNVKGVPLSDAENMAGIETVLAQGHKFTRLDFAAMSDSRESLGGAQSASERAEKQNWTFRTSALAMVRGEKTGAQIIADIVAKPYLTAEEAGVSAAVRLAHVKEDFTTLEFSFYIADMYREMAGADIGLINHGNAFGGNLGRVFAGDIYDTFITPIKPRSFANKSTLVKVSMTGRQLMDALNHPLT